MFSGIVEAASSVLSVQKKQAIHTIQIKRPFNFNDIQLGDSIAVNGVCLTVSDLTNSFFQFDLVPETLKRSNLSWLEIGGMVNLERSLKISQRLSGHYVQGHVDTITKIVDIKSFGEAKLLTFSTPLGHELYLVEKGYITLDGMSLTIVSVSQSTFQIAFIPHTLQQTIAQYYQAGNFVNIETDILGKYILNYLNKTQGAHYGEN